MVASIKLCTDGPVFSRFVFGLWRLTDWGYSPQERLTLTKQCLDLGITTFDQADIYGDYQSQPLWGEALALDPGLRDQIQIVTKCDIKLVSTHFPSHTIPHYDSSREHIIASVDQSLRDLHTDRIDVLLLHRPDPLMDADEVAEAFETLRNAGKVLHFGVSNFTPSQFALLQDRLPYPLVTNQVECSVLAFDVMHDGTLDQAQMLRRAPMAWSPFAGGRLFTGKDDQAKRVQDCMEELRTELGGASPDQLAIAWLLQHPSNILPVLGTGKIERVQSALEAATISLTRQQWFKIWTASKGYNVP